MSKFDFHMHSVASCDGEKSLEELLRIAADSGLSHIAIADHNTMDSVAPALALAPSYGIDLIPAVELDCLYRERVFHVLGYGVDDKDPGLKRIERDIQEQERRNADLRIAKFRAAGVELDPEEVYRRAHRGYFVTGELVAEIVLNKAGAEDNPLYKKYFPGGERSDNPYVNFFWDWCDVGKPAYVHVQYVPLRAALEAIHGAGGLAVLAHPGQNLKGRLEWLDEMLEEEFDGIECFSTYHSAELNRYFYAQAEKRGLLVTGGSDFHGKTKPSIRMGDFGLDDEDLGARVLSAFLERLRG